VEAPRSRPLSTRTIDEEEADEEEADEEEADAEEADAEEADADEAGTSPAAIRSSPQKSRRNTICTLGATKIDVNDEVSR